MKNLITLLAVVGTGIAVGTVAGKLINTEKLRNFKIERSGQKTKLVRFFTSKPVEEPEICFI